MGNKKPSQSHDPLVSIVILDWNGLDDTIKCLKSVADLTYQNYEVIIVNNGSSRPIRKKDVNIKKVVKIVNNPVNLGFAGGEISALPHCSGDFIFLLNNDALIEKNALTEAVSTFDTDESIAVVGGRSYSLLEDHRESLGYNSFQYIDPVTAETRTYSHDDGIQDTVTVSGSSVMIRRSVIEKFGYFDERFFAYYEETDLFARYLRAGMRIVYNPKVIIWHKDGASTKDKRFMYYYLMLKNQFLFAYKNFNKKALREFLVTYRRNFRRSLWLYMKNGVKTEGIHKARVRSTLWNIANILGTTASRKNTQAINPKFDYTNTLLTMQPIRTTLVLDARNDPKDVASVVNHILKGSSFPAEIIVITRKPVELPTTANQINIRGVIDKGYFGLSTFDLGFMSSNTDVLLFADSRKLHSGKHDIADTLTSAYRSIITHEAAVAVERFSGSDLRIANGHKAKLVAIRKPDLVNFLDIHTDIYTIDEASLGTFINWLVTDCRPVARLTSTLPALQHTIKTPLFNDATSTTPIRWRLKKVARVLHVARIISVFKKRVLRKNPLEQEPRELGGLEPFPSYGRGVIQKTPIFINMRDRAEPVKKLLAWLEKGKYKDIIFIDNESTYPELLDLYASTPYQVIPLGRNGMHKSPWESFSIRFIAKGRPYIVTDPDIIPTSETPISTIKHLYDALKKYPDSLKAGVALKIDDLPDHYSMKQSVIDWESRFWNDELLLENGIYRADVDTTFALYKGNTWWALSPSLRVAGKYAMRHEPWYQNLDKPSDDMMYYRVRASNDVSTWTKGKLPKHHLRALKKEGLL